MRCWEEDSFLADMPKFKIITLGCKVNQAESEAIANLIVVDWDSAPVADQSVDYRVVERRWSSVQEED